MKHEQEPSYKKMTNSTLGIRRWVLFLTSNAGVMQKEKKKREEGRRGDKCLSFEQSAYGLLQKAK